MYSLLCEDFASFRRLDQECEVSRAVRLPSDFEREHGSRRHRKRHGQSVDRADPGRGPPQARPFASRCRTLPAEPALVELGQPKAKLSENPGGTIGGAESVHGPVLKRAKFSI